MVKEKFEGKVIAIVSNAYVILKNVGNRRFVMDFPKFGAIDRKIHAHNKDIFKLTIEKVKA